MVLTRLESIERGWSGDRKYKVKDSKGGEYFLRLVGREKGDRLREIFRLEEDLHKRGLPIPRPIEVGETEDSFYILESWIDGRSAEEEIPLLASTDQFNYGLEAGNILRLIHTLPVPTGLSSWQQRFNAKIDRNIRIYKS